MQMYLQGLFLLHMKHLHGCSPDSHRLEECWGREELVDHAQESRAPWQQTWKAGGEGVMPVTIQLLEKSLIFSVPSLSMCSRAPVNRFWTWAGDFSQDNSHLKYYLRIDDDIDGLPSPAQYLITDNQRSWGFESFLEDKACTRAVSLLLS